MKVSEVIRSRSGSPTVGQPTGLIRLAMGVLIVLLVATGCDDVWNSPGDSDADPVDPVPATEIVAIAEDIYDALDGGYDISDRIETILSRFAPVLDLDTKATPVDGWLNEFVDSALPVFFDFQVDALSAGFAARMLVAQDSFFASMNSAGISQSTELMYLSPEWVALILPAMLDGKETYAPEEELPALLLALSRERAQRWETGGTDDVSEAWGDAYFDPLQFTLFSYALHYAAIDHSDQAASHRSFQRSAAQPSSRSLRDQITGFVGDVIGLPVNGLQAFQASVGASALLYGHTFSMSLEPATVWKRWPEAPDTNPFEGAATVTVMFDFVPRGPVRAAVLEFALGGPPPPAGPAAGKSVNWSLQTTAPAGQGGGGVTDHGELSYAETVTDQSGLARATYTADDETVPLEKREDFDFTMGVLEATVGNLMPGKWQTVSAVVVRARSLGELDSRLSVRWYLDDPSDPSPSQSWSATLVPPALDL